jgi:hypothetical protein
MHDPLQRAVPPASALISHIFRPAQPRSIHNQDRR